MPDALFNFTLRSTREGSMHCRAPWPSRREPGTGVYFLLRDSMQVQDYLTELEEPMSTIYSKSQIDRAMVVAYNQTRVCMCM